MCSTKWEKPRWSAASCMDPTATLKRTDTAPAGVWFLMMA